MNPVYAHLVIVHFPVVGVLFTLAIMVLGVAASDRRITVMGCVFTVVCAVTAAVAYGTGPPAYESIQHTLSSPIQDLAEEHALVGRAAFIVTLLTGVVALQVLLRTAAAEMPSAWVTRGLVVLLVLLAAILLWAAKLGGGIGHPEAHTRVVPISSQSWISTTNPPPSRLTARMTPE